MKFQEMKILKLMLVSTEDSKINEDTKWNDKISDKFKYL